LPFIKKMLMSNIHHSLAQIEPNSPNHALPQAIISMSALEADIAQREKELASPNTASKTVNHLQTILDTRELLRRRKNEEITFAKAIISRKGVPILFPNTINLIQGQAGSHKSRFAELFMSVLLKLLSCENPLLGFESNQDIDYTGFFVDTERNLTEQLPYALQQIQVQAGYYRTDNPANFEFASLLEIPRKERFVSLSAFLQQIRSEHKNHVFIVLDVVTDCIEDFNRSDDSMQLTDMLNVMINRYDVTFLCVIHENPNGSNKARGHIGTELMNKSSTVMQVSFEPNSDNSPSNIIKLKFLKCRSTERPEPIHVIFDKEQRQLVLAETDEVNEVFEKRKNKAVESDVIDYLSEIAFPVSKKQLVSDLEKWFDANEKTIYERLMSIIAHEKVIYRDNKPFILFKDDKQGRNVMFNLKPMEENEPS
jgi:hypothetical protein